MIYKWEKDEERLLKFLKISPKKKLGWLRQMNDFMAKYTPKRYAKLRLKLRDSQ